MNKNNFLLIFTVIIFFGVQPLYSQFGAPNDIVQIKTYQSFDKVYSGSEFKIAIEGDVKDGWHINSNIPKEDYLIPTQLHLTDSTDFKLTKIVYPQAKDIKLDFSEKALSVFEGKIYIGGIIKSANLPC